MDVKLNTLTGHSQLANKNKNITKFCMYRIQDLQVDTATNIETQSEISPSPSSLQPGGR